MRAGWEPQPSRILEEAAVPLPQRGLFLLAYTGALPISTGGASDWPSALCPGRFLPTLENCVLAIAECLQCCREEEQAVPRNGIWNVDRSAEHLCRRGGTAGRGVFPGFTYDQSVLCVLCVCNKPIQTLK